MGKTEQKSEEEYSLSRISTTSAEMLTEDTHSHSNIRWEKCGGGRERKEDQRSQNAEIGKSQRIHFSQMGSLLIKEKEIGDEDTKKGKSTGGGDEHHGNEKYSNDGSPPRNIRKRPRETNIEG